MTKTEIDRPVCPICKKVTTVSQMLQYGACSYCSEDAPYDGPTCESCSEPATHVTADDVDMCAECYQVLCDEQGVTGTDAEEPQQPLSATRIARDESAAQKSSSSNQDGSER